MESDYLKYIESENSDVIESYTCTHPTAKTTLLNVTILGSDLKTRISNNLLGTMPRIDSLNPCCLIRLGHRD